MTISSNTIVKNGMPFIGRVLQQVEPYMDKMFITVSEKCIDQTMNVVETFQNTHGDKVIVDTENVKRPDELTHIQQMQLDQSDTDWILFMSDDDFWPRDQLKKVLDLLGTDENILAYSVSPYQLIDYEHYDESWKIKSFSKFFRREGARYIKNWPRELIADKNNAPLYWRKHPQVKKLPWPEYYFYHLSYMKNHSFRNEEWATSFRINKGNALKLPESFSVI